MSRFRTSKIEEKIAYEIFRSCRLCGAGAGYKMPIVQNVDWDGDVPLTQKIRECVQIEVHQEDKMPPLICELCVDKVNDFYEFSEMCKQTNMKTRLRLGLPPQTMPRGAPNAGDCILGVTETIFANDDSNEPIIKHVGKQSKSKKETSDKVKMKSSENSRNSKSRLSPDTNRRATRRSISSPTNVLTSRNTNSKDQKNVQPKKKSSEPLKSILKKEKNNEEDILVTPKSKRARDRDSISDLPVKRVKIEDTATSSKSKRKSRSPPRYRTRSPTRSRTRSPPKSRTRSPETNVCKVCKRSFPNKGRLENHVKTHQNEIKNSKTKKSPPVAETKYKDRTEKIQVRGKNDSKQKDRNMCDCGKEYSTPRNLHRHRINCKYKKDVIIDPKLMSKIRPLQIRISRCDPILDKKDSISEIPHVFGLDKNCTYPYFNIKREPKTGKDAMVRIESPIKHVFDEADYIHWDSDTSTDSNNEPIQKKNKISTLSILSLKTIFSSRYLGRVRRRKRKVKTEIIEKLTEKDNFDVIDSFDDVHDLERINDSSFDQLFGNDYQNISVPNPEDIKDIGIKNKDECLEEGNNTEDISKEENRNIDVSKKDNDKEISKEENTNKDDSIEENIDKEVSKENSNADDSIKENSNKEVDNEENSNKDVSKEENNDIDISKQENSNTEVSKEEDSNIDDSKEEDINKEVSKEEDINKEVSKEEDINKEVSKEDTSDKECSVSKEDTEKHKLSKEVINSENSLQKQGNGNDKEDSNLNEETDKTVNNQENSNNDENDSVKENVNQKEDSLNEDVNSINKDSRFSKEDINSNECENIQELNKKNIDERNIEHKKETNGLSEDVKGNKDDKVRIEQKDIQEDSVDSGNFIINKELSNSLNNELEDNKRNANPLQEKTHIQNQSIEKTELKQTDIKNIDKYKDTSNNNNSNETEDILLDNKKSIEINKPENYKFNKEQTDIKEKELKDLRNEELITENDLLGDTNDTLSQGSIEFDERELDSDESLDKNIKENSGNANKEVINEDSKVKEITSTVVNGESNDDVVMDDQKLMDELNAQIGEDVMEKHLSLDDFSEDEDF